MTQGILNVVNEIYLEKIIEANIKNGSLFMEIHPYLDKKDEDRDYWLQISLLAHPSSILPDANTSELTQLQWEIVKQVTFNENELGYIMNFLAPLGVVGNETKVIFSASFIHHIIKYFADNNPYKVDKLNNCIGIERIQVVPMGDEFGIALIVPD